MTQTRITWLGQPTSYNVTGPHSARIFKQGKSYRISPKNGTDHTLRPDGVIYDIDNVGESRIADNLEYWRLAFKQALENATPNLFLKIVHKIGKSMDNKFGDYLLSRENGGFIPVAQNGTKLMNQILSIVKAAAKEIQKGKIGQAVQQLVQIMNDDQGSQLLNHLIEQQPEIGEVTKAALELVQSNNLTVMAKCGTKLNKKLAKKSIQKASCGCQTKIAKFGSKLVEVDCNGIPIAKKGCKVKKAELGLSEGLNKQYLGSAKTGIETTVPTGPRTYYDSATQTWMTQSYDGTKGGWQNASPLATAAKTTNSTGNAGDVHRYWDLDAGKMMIQTYSSDPNNLGWTNAKEDSNFGNLYNAGFDYTKKTYDTKANAIAALGQEGFNKYNLAGQTLAGVTALSGNKALGTTGGTINSDNEYIQAAGGNKQAADAAFLTYLNGKAQNKATLNEQLKRSWKTQGASINGTRERIAAKKNMRAANASLKNFAGNMNSKWINASNPGNLNLKRVQVQPGATVSYSNTQDNSNPNGANGFVSAPSWTASNKQGGWLHKFDTVDFAKCGKKLKKKEVRGEISSATCGKKLLKKKK